MKENLLKNLIDHKEEALNDFNVQYGSLTRYVLRQIVTDEEDLKEAYNEVLLKVWNNIASYDEKKGSFVSWLTVIAHNVAVDKVKRKPTTVEYVDSHQYESAQPGYAQERLQQVLEIVEGFSDTDRQIFYRKYYYQLPVNTIAAEMGMSGKAVESRLFRIRKRLKEEIGGNG